MRKFQFVILAITVILIIFAVSFYEKNGGGNSSLDQSAKSGETEEIQPIVSSTPTETKTAAKNDQALSPAKNAISNGVNPEFPPASFQIKNVAFTSQAPFAVWDELHKEACEEAALYTVKNYLDGQRGVKIAPEQADEEIKKMVAWQEKNWGGHFDLSIQKVGELAEAIYGLEYAKHEINGVQDIQKIIAKGDLVIAPTAGRELKNPYFQTPGPIYHMLVVTGYDEKYFYTNDVGTRRGANFKYLQKTLFNAIHDLPAGFENHQKTLSEEDILLGGKNVLTLKSQI